jgi:glucan phosphoethanolaminetransferase (alkaline phosphatase superfamily)
MLPFCLSLLVCNFTFSSAIYVSLLGLAYAGAVVVVLRLGCWPWLAVVSFPFCAFWLVFLLLFDCAPNLGVVLTIQKTSGAETLEWMRHHPGLIALAFLLWLCLLLAAKRAGSQFRELPPGLVMAAGLLALLASAACVVINDQAGLHRRDGKVRMFDAASLTELATINDSTWPLGMIRLIDQARQQGHWHASEDPALAPVRPVRQSLQVHQAPAGLTVVMVVGESQRADWLSPVNRPDLMPTLHARWKAGRLLELPNMWSVSNLTMYALPGMLTGVAPNGLMAQVRGAPSGLGYLKSVGFFTGYVSNQTNVLFAENGWDYYQRPQSVELYDQYLALQLQRIVAKPGVKRALVLQMMGSHFHYQDRVPAQFVKQHKVMLAQATLAHALKPPLVRQAINDYAATIAYSAQVLENMLQVLDQSPDPAVLIFCSDHGENLYDDQRQYYWHGGYRQAGIPELRPAALVAWNAAYANQFQQPLAQLQTIAKGPLQQQNLLPIWLRLAGFSLTQPNPHDPFATGWRAQTDAERAFFISGELVKQQTLDFPGKL